MKIGNKEYKLPFVYDEGFVIADADGNIIAEAVARKDGEIDWDECAAIGQFIANALNFLSDASARVEELEAQNKFKMGRIANFIKQVRKLEKAIKTALEFMDGTNSDRYLARKALENALESVEGKSEI